MIKTPYQDFLEFYANYWEVPTGRRLGEAFLIEFYPEDINSHLFYQEDNYKAVSTIVEFYIDPETAPEWNYSEVVQR